MNDMLKRLNILYIHIIGAVVVLVLALILYIAVVKPKNDELAGLKTQVQATQDAGGTQEKVTQHQRDLEKTKATAADTTAKWTVNEVKYMPNLDLTGDLLTAYENKLIKIPTDWGKWVTAWYDSQRPLGVTLAPGTAFPVDSFPTDPNYLSTLTSLRFPQTGSWPVNIQARSFDAAMAHLRRFNDMSRHGMPVIDNVSLAGQSPNLQMTYTLALYIIPAHAPPPSDPFLTQPGGGAGASTAASSMYGGAGGAQMMRMMSGGAGAPMGGGGGKRGGAAAQ